MKKRYPVSFFIILFHLSLIHGNVASQDIENIFISDSIAIDTFPPPRNMDGYTQDDAAYLWWEVPLLIDTIIFNDTTFLNPANLIGYNLYRNEAFLDYIAYDENDTTSYWDFTTPYPGFYDYAVTALYDLTPAGLPGDTAESEPTPPKELWVGYEGMLPFVENWETGSFDPNLWTTDTCWDIIGSLGNPEPSAAFIGHPLDTNYQHPLISYWINCRDHPNTADPYIDGDFCLEFDVKLNANTSSGDELLIIQIADSLDWESIDTISNIGSSFDWETFKYNITLKVKGEMTRFTFVAEGQDASNINTWYIDNIRLYRYCNPPRDLHWVVFDTLMSWTAPLPHSDDTLKPTQALLGYDIYDDDSFLDFTTDTFYYFNNPAGYGPFYVGAKYEDCIPVSNEIFGPVRICERVHTNEIRIFPNPADDELNIHTDKKIDRLKVIGTSGTEYFQSFPANKQTKIKTTNLKDGLYILELGSGRKIYRQKFIIHHP